MTRTDLKMLRTKLKALAARSNTLSLQTMLAVHKAYQAGVTTKELTEDLGVSRRQVFTMISVAAYVQAAKAPRADYVRVGISRLLILSRYAAPEDWAEHRTHALTLSVEALTDLLTSKASSRVAMRLKFSPKERLEIERILLSAGARRGKGPGLGKEDVLLSILRDWSKTKIGRAV